MESGKNRSAVALLSGGMDSATAAAIAKHEGWMLHVLAVDYGQRARAELESARRIADALEVESFRTVGVDLRALGGSALTDDIDVPKGRSAQAIGEGIPVTYVPARNTVFLALALAAAETADARGIVLGVNALDYSGYPDCRPDFLKAFSRVAATGTKQGVEGNPVKILAPLIEMTKGDIVRRGLELGVPFEHTLSCYDPVEKDGAWLHCGRCDACSLRRKGFLEADAEDPAPRAS
ncbi:MAG: 7-cyano-7-deazaguanine synthase QueC [Planctomycetota bacterium]|nr:7-cyano-7-deazaguanine synthase QueC [Planctomycetota bacterium]